MNRLREGVGSFHVPITLSNNRNGDGHGIITIMQPMIWIREPFYLKPTGLNKKVIFGHTPAMYLHESGDIWFSPLNDKIGIDGGCVFGKQLNCLEIKKHNDYVTHVIYKAEPPISNVI